MPFVLEKIINQIIQKLNYQNFIRKFLKFFFSDGEMKQIEGTKEQREILAYNDDINDDEDETEQMFQWSKFSNNLDIKTKKNHSQNNRERIVYIIDI